MYPIILIFGWIRKEEDSLALSQVPPVEKAPVLMLRPRAWNMTEHNVLLGEVEKDIIFKT